MAGELLALAEVYTRMSGEFDDFLLGEATIRPSRGLIETAGAETRVKPKAMAVLVALARRPGEVVSRAELFAEVWSGQAVTDDVLTTCLVELRRALTDDARSPRYIETIPRRGVRLIASLGDVTDNDGLPPQSRPQPRPLAFGRVALAFAAIVGAIPVAIAAVLLVRDVPDPRDAAALEVAPSLAVLPFVNMSEADEADYFADGLSEELINRLSRLNGLSVTARTSSFFFKDQNVDLRDVGEQLSVGYVLEGSVRRSAEELRVTAQLIDVQTGYHLWSDTYDRSLDDVFDIQDDISESVAMAMSVALGVGELGALEGGTRSVAAFDAFVRGTAAHREFDADSQATAIEAYREAVSLDPEFSLAWVALSNAYRTAWITFGNEHADHWAELADEAIATAQELNPRSLPVLWTPAYIEVDRRRWSDARALFEEIEEVAPNVTPDSAYLDLLAKTGFADEAMAIQERMRALDPFNGDKSMYFGHLHLMRGEVTNALNELERGYALDVNRAQVAVEGLVAALASGDESQVERWLERAVAYEQPGAFGVHSAMRPQYRDADASLAYLRQGFEEQSIPDYYVIAWASYFGADDLALRALQRSPDLWIMWTPLLGDLRGSDEFQVLLTGMGLVDYWSRYGWNDYCRPLDGTAFTCN